MTPEVFGKGAVRCPLSLTRVSAPLYSVSTALMRLGGRFFSQPRLSFSLLVLFYSAAEARAASDRAVSHMAASDSAASRVLSLAFATAAASRSMSSS